jgi:hypothetical protein
MNAQSARRDDEEQVDERAWPIFEHRRRRWTRHRALIPTASKGTLAVIKFNASLLCDDFVVKIRQDFVNSKRYNFLDSISCSAL